jgi:putative transposase
VDSPQSNGTAEYFVKTLKRVYAKLAERPDSQTVMAQLPEWFDDYNSHYSRNDLVYVSVNLFRGIRAVS